VAKTEEEAQLLDTEIGWCQRGGPVPRISSVDQGGGLDAVAEEKALGAREFLDGWDQPQQKLEMRLDRRAVAAFWRGQAVKPQKALLPTRGCAPGPRQQKKQ
jgi:hypothetical protein